MHRGWFFNITMGCTTERMSATCRISIILNSPHLYLDHTFTDWTTNVLQSMSLGLSFAMLSFVPLFYVLVQTSLGCLLNSFVFYLPLFHVLEGFTLALATVAIVLTSDRLSKWLTTSAGIVILWKLTHSQRNKCRNVQTSAFLLWRYVWVSVCVCLKTAWVFVNVVLSENFWVVLLTKDRCWLHVVKRMSGHFIWIAFKKYSYTKSMI